MRRVEDSAPKAAHYSCGLVGEVQEDRGSGLCSRSLVLVLETNRSLANGSRATKRTEPAAADRDERERNETRKATMLLNMNTKESLCVGGGGVL
jgi:hypothetical protein